MRQHTPGLAMLAALAAVIAPAAESHCDHGLVDTHASPHTKLRSVDLLMTVWIPVS